MGTNTKDETRNPAGGWEYLEEIPHLPDNWFYDKKFSDVAAWTNIKPAVLKTPLLDPSVNKNRPKYSEIKHS